MSYARVVFAHIFVASLLFTGCGPSQQLVDQQAAALDSLQAEREEWQLRYEAAADSLQLYDDIDSGQYAREMRLLRDRLDRLHYDLGVLRDGGRAIATIEADDLFEPASATLTAAGQERLDGLAERLNGLYENRPIRVEGHADNVPITGSLQERYPSNWELSGARAASVVRYLIDEHGLPEDRFHAVALSDTTPVASNSSATGRRQNRRVRISVYPPLLDHTRPYDEAW